MYKLLTPNNMEAKFETIDDLPNDIDIITRRERERLERNKFICDRFAALTNKYPEASKYRKMVVIANQIGFSIEGVRRVLKAHGVIGK